LEVSQRPAGKPKIALFNSNGKTANQPRDLAEVPAVLVFDESSQPPNTFVVTVIQRAGIRARLEI